VGDAAMSESKRTYKPGQTDMDGAEQLGEEASPQPFPLECLPPVAGDMARAICETVRVPATLPGCCILGILSASIGAGLQVESDSSRVTRANLYTLASAVSGSGKSETFRHAAKPFQDFEAEMLAKWRAEILPKAQAEKELIEQDIEELKKAFRKKNGAVEREEARATLQTKRAELLKLEAALQAPRLSVEDVTTEKLAVMLANQGECMASLSPDAGAIVNNILGRYNKLDRTDDNIYLKAFSGDPCRVDRQGREPVVLNRPCLAVLWLVQPDKIETLLGEKSLTDGGLMPRFLICHTRAEPQPIAEDAPGIPTQTGDAWAQLVRDLLNAFHLAAQPVTVRPTPEAKQALNCHYNGIVERRRPGGDLLDVGTFAARWNEQGWRIAVCIHAAKHGATAGGQNLDLETAQAAIKLADWFAGEQLRILAGGRIAARRALQDKVLELLADKPQGITARIVHRARTVGSADEARALLAQMEADGELTHTESKPEGGGHVTLTYTKAKL
jgi:hypothetical protein